MKYIYFFLCLLLGMSVQAQIKIGDNPQNIDPSSVLELESSSRVLVITRVNSAQMNAIVPSAGALVYNTDIQCIHYYTGTEWKDICDAVAGSITFTSDDGTVVITPNGGNNYDVKVGQITGMNIVNETIFGADIATATIGERQLAPNSVGSSELQDNTVGKTEIQEAAVGTLEIIDGTIQPSDMQPGAFDQILTTNAAGNVVWLNKNELGATQADQTTITGAGTSANPIKVADTVIGDILANTNSITVNTTNIAQNSNDIADINTALGTKEDVANKSDDTALGNSTTLYPTQNAVKTYVDLLAGAASTLADGNIFVGSAGNVATGVTMGGDATILNSGAVTIADLAITSSKIGLNAVGEPQLANNSITSAIIRDGEVRTGDILNGNVTNAKLDKANIPLSGFGAAATNVDLGNNRIINLDDPQDQQDAATRAFVLAQVGGSAQVIVSADADNVLTESLVDGGAYYNDLDPDPLNEIELPTGGTAGQVLSTNGSGGYTWITDNGGTDTDEQQLTLEAGNLLTLEDGGTPINLTPFLDNTDAQNATAVPVAATPTNYAVGAANVEAHLAGIDAAIGAVGGNQDLASVLGNGTSAGNNQINNLSEPTAAQDAATMAYVLSQAATGSETIIDAVNSTIGVTGIGTSGNPYVLTGAAGTPAASGVTFAPYLSIGATDTQTAIENLKDEVDNLSISGGGENPNNELNETFIVNGLNLELTDAGGTIQVPLAQIDTDDQNAAEVPFTPAGNTTSANVQAAIEEIQTEIDGIAIDGEANTSSNSGVGGVTIALPKVGVNLPFKSINAASNKVSVTNDATNNEVDIDINDANLAITESQITDLVHTINTDNQTATDVPFTPAGNTTSANVQTAIEEIQTEIDGIPVGGEINTASNQGTAGVTTFIQKTGVDLEFKSINAASNKVTVTNDVTNNEVDIDINDTNLTITESQISDLTHTINTDNQTAIQVPFTATGNTTSTDVQAAIAELQTDIDGISAGGEVNTASNQGTAGVATFIQKTGVDLEFRSINAASNKVTVTNDVANSEVDIDINDANLTISESQISDLSHTVNTDNQTASQVPVTATPTNYTAATSDVEAHLAGIDAALTGSQNLFEANLTLGANRTHDLDGNNFILGGAGNVAIGTLPGAPTSKLDVDGTVTARNGFAATEGSNGNPGYGFFTNGDTNTGMYRIAEDRLGFSTGGNLAVQISAIQDVGIGIIPTEKLHVDGNILAAGNITGVDITATGNLQVNGNVNVTGTHSPVPDYVFQKYFTGDSNLDPNYNFSDLLTIENFIKANHHLPGILSASEIKTQGFWDLGQASKLNLEKIEELFLHTIEQEKKIDQLKTENESLSTELQSLRKDMDEIKALLQNKH